MKISGSLPAHKVKEKLISHNYGSQCLNCPLGAAYQQSLFKSKCQLSSTLEQIVTSASGPQIRYLEGGKGWCCTKTTKQTTRSTRSSCRHSPLSSWNWNVEQQRQTFPSGPLPMLPSWVPCGWGQFSDGSSHFLSDNREMNFPEAHKKNPAWLNDNSDKQEPPRGESFPSSLCYDMVIMWYSRVQVMFLCAK